MKVKESRIRGAAVKYLDMNGYDVIEDDFMGFVVAFDKSVLVFAKVRYGVMEMPEETDMRLEFESVAAEYMASHDVEDTKLRCDTISLNVMRSDRAILRHYVNCLG